MRIRTKITSLLLLLFVFGICNRPAAAQTNAASATEDGDPSVLWRLMRYAGVLDVGPGRAMPSVAGMTFSLYNQASGGAALWMETQNVPVDSQGHYTAFLGAVSAEGIPEEVFASSRARWLGIQISGRSGEERVPLATVPYAVQSGDAESLGGKPAAEYVRRDELQSALSGTTPTRITSAATAAAPPSDNGNGNGQGVTNSQLKVLLDQLIANDTAQTTAINQIIAKQNAPPTIEDALKFELCLEAGFQLEGESESWVKIGGEGQGKVGADVYGNGAFFSLKAMPEKKWSWNKKFGLDLPKLGGCVDIWKAIQVIQARSNTAVSSKASFDSSAGLSTTGLLDAMQNLDKTAFMNKILGVANTFQMDPAKLQNVMDIAGTIQESGGLFEMIQNDSSRTAVLDALPIPPNVRSAFQNPGSLITNLKQVKDAGICNMTSQVPALQPLLGEICGLANDKHFANLLDRLEPAVVNVKSAVDTVQSSVNAVSTKVQNVLNLMPGGSDCKIFC